MILAPRLVAVALALGAAFGCSNPRSDAPPAPAPVAAAEPDPGPAPAAITPAPVPAPTMVTAADTSVPANFPRECMLYAQLIQRLGTCDKIGGGREGLVRGFEELRMTWPSVAVAQRAAFEAQCKAQADGLRNAVAATCSW